MADSLYSILVCEPMSDEGLLILKNHPGFKVDVCLELSREKLLQKITEYDCLLVRSQTTVDKQLLSAGKNLKLVGRAGVGIDNIDKDWAEKNNITVINTPTGNSISTAEFAFGLMLSLARKIPFARDHLLSGNWQRSKFTGRELHGNTLGIVGFGNVGRILALRANAFKMRVIAYDPLVDRSVFTEHGVEKLTLDDLLAQSHFISFHCGLNEHTKNMINEDNIAKMKKGVVLINTARGELIKADALLKALNNDQVAAAAIDVFAVEPPAKDDALVNHPKVLATPHLGASTIEAQKRVSTLLAEKTIGFFTKL